MSYSHEFSQAARKCEDAGLTFEKANDGCLVYSASHGNVETYKFYDFIARTVTTSVQVHSGDDNSHVEPFSAIDAETLAFMREKLTDLGGSPPPLPDTKRNLISKAP